MNMKTSVYIIDISWLGVQHLYSTFMQNLVSLAFIVAGNCAFTLRDGRSRVPLCYYILYPLHKGQKEIITF